MPKLQVLQVKRYNPLKALCYEAAFQYTEWKPEAKRSWWYKRIRAECFPDWVEFKTKETMDDIAKQELRIIEEWHDNYNSTPEYYETEDGGMGIRAPWVK